LFRQRKFVSVKCLDYQIYLDYQIQYLDYQILVTQLKGVRERLRYACSKWGYACSKSPVSVMAHPVTQLKVRYSAKGRAEGDRDMHAAMRYACSKWEQIVCFRVAANWLFLQQMTVSKIARQENAPPTHYVHYITISIRI